MQYEILRGDCIEHMRALPDASFDAIVTDPPYELTSARPGGRSAATEGAVMKGFMGMAWDGSGIAFNVAMWREALRVLKPGGHLLAFSGSRTYHRMTCAIEDAGFDIRDQIMWVYGSGFPKSMDVSKAIDKQAGAETLDTEKWGGWGTALQPAHEPICVARKPLAKGATVAANVLQHGTGAINIDGCRVGDEVLPAQTAGQAKLGTFERGVMVTPERTGRWPANLIHDGSDEVLALFPESSAKNGVTQGCAEGGIWSASSGKRAGPTHGDSGSAARFFYCAKASKSDRGPNNTHPTVKPLALMQYLCRLVTPPGGKILDPFAGSGSTIVAALREGFTATGIELLDDHADIIEGRLDEELYGDII